MHMILEQNLAKGLNLSSLPHKFPQGTFLSALCCTTQSILNKASHAKRRSYLLCSTFLWDCRDIHEGAIGTCFWGGHSFFTGVERDNDRNAPAAPLLLLCTGEGRLRDRSICALQQCSVSIAETRQLLWLAAQAIYCTSWNLDSLGPHYCIWNRHLVGNTQEIRMPAGRKLKILFTISTCRILFGVQIRDSVFTLLGCHTASSRDDSPHEGGPPCKVNARILKGEKLDLNL